MRIPGKIAIWVFCLVFLAIVIIQSGNYSYVQDNSVTNFGPSGTSAFFELIKRRDYKVALTSSRSPATTKTMVIPVSESNIDSFEKFLKTIKGDTTIVSFIIPTEDRTAQKEKQIINLDKQEPVGSMVPIRLKSKEWEKPPLEDAEREDLLATTEDQTTVAQVTCRNDIKIIQLLDAACITNRHIDKANNASISVGLVGMATKPGSDITYVGTFSSNSLNDSLLAKLGRPFEAAWSQLLLLILVIFLTLSVRFGLAPERRATQRGASELVDGLAWMTRRKKSARWALRAVFDRVLTELERRHRISREQIIQRPDLYLSPEAAVLLKDVEAATMNDISEQEAIAYAKALKRLV